MLAGVNANRFVKQNLGGLLRQLLSTLRQAWEQTAQLPDTRLYLDKVLPAWDERPDWFSDGGKLAALCGGAGCGGCHQRVLCRLLKDLQRFDIGRYIAPREEHRQPACAPFGKGPHNCLGASLSELILPLHMGLLLYLMKEEPVCNLDKVRMTFKPAPVLTSNFRVWLRWRKP